MVGSQAAGSSWIFSLSWESPR